MARDDERCGECHSMNLKVVNIRDIFHPSHKGPVIAICSEGDREVAEIADDMITVPDVVEYLQPIIVSIPLQLLAYEIAVQPR